MKKIIYFLIVFIMVFSILLVKIPSKEIYGKAIQKPLTQPSSLGTINLGYAKINEDNEITFLHRDHLSTTSKATNEDGEIVFSYDSYAFGNTLKQIGEEKYTFTDKQKDKSTNLFYFGARYYSPEIGRFTTIDKISGRDYLYTGNNPLRFIDPAGTQFEDCLEPISLKLPEGYPLPLETWKIHETHYSKETGHTAFGWIVEYAGTRVTYFPEANLKPNDWYMHRSGFLVNVKETLRHHTFEKHKRKTLDYYKEMWDIMEAMAYPEWAVGNPQSFIENQRPGEDINTYWDDEVLAVMVNPNAKRSTLEVLKDYRFETYNRLAFGRGEYKQPAIFINADLGGLDRETAIAAGFYIDLYKTPENEVIINDLALRFAQGYKEARSHHWYQSGSVSSELKADLTR